ncbi:aldehyde dehydrogenase (NADP(+)) [Daeguia caeni]|uniref:Aldehyde dehydrogenase (NADP(+)) n=1 Tax=Daeguia caeni TaxID=439612 RepID=A0ABV9H7M4_9HYPH
MAFIPTGKVLIAGEWQDGVTTFQSSPAHGPVHTFFSATLEQVNKACEAAEDAFWSFGYSSRAERAAFIRTIAAEIDARIEDIVVIAMQESGLPEVRLRGECGRTTGQLRLFADHIEKGDYLDRRVDPALPDRQPAPRPEIRLMERPIGPVAVFGASNFPLAFSTAGGDTASALAAGCPVVVKGHPAHPGTCEIIALAIEAAIKKCGVHPGVFSLIHDAGYEIAHALVKHPLIKAVGFTGSLAGGRALFDLCAARPEPIPFFGELGSVNPMFLLPEAIKARAETIGQGWIGSLTLGAGQFCTNPGIAIVIDGPDAERFIASAVEAASKVGPQTMLTDGIAAAYRKGQARFEASNAVKTLYRTESEGRQALPNLYETTGDRLLADHTLREEVFGPLGLVVRVGSVDEMITLAKGFEGQLTSTIHMDDADLANARRLLPVLERKAGRVLVNGFSTGVEVIDSMVHGGPYPASTNFGATSVGTLAIRRFLRPVCYQNLPRDLLPEDLAF